MDFNKVHARTGLSSMKVKDQKDFYFGKEEKEKELESDMSSILGEVVVNRFKVDEDGNEVMDSEMS